MIVWLRGSVLGFLIAPWFVCSRVLVVVVAVGEQDAAVGDGQFVTAVNTARNQNNANTDSGSPKALAHATKRSDGAVVVAVSAGMMSSVVVPKLSAATRTAAATTAPSTATTTTAAPATAAATKRGAAPKRDRSLGGLSERFVQIFLLGVRACSCGSVCWHVVCGPAAGSVG